MALGIAGLAGSLIKGVSGGSKPITSGSTGGNQNFVGATRNFTIQKGDGNSASQRIDPRTIANGPTLPSQGPAYPASVAGFPIEKALLYGGGLILALAALKMLRK